MSLKNVIRYINAMILDLERQGTFQYDQEPSSPEQYKVWDRRMEENNSVEVVDNPNVQQPREPYYQVQLYGKNSSQNDPSFWTEDEAEILDDEGMWIDSEEDFDGDLLEEGDWDVFSDEDLEEDGEHTAAPRRRPSKPAAYRKYRQYWRKNRQKYREKKRDQRKKYRRKKPQILRRRKLLKNRTPGRVRPSQSF